MPQPPLVTLNCEVQRAFAPLLSASQRQRQYNLTERVDRLGIRYCLWAGGLIGYCLYGEMLPWDDDIDLVLLDEVKVEWLSRRLPDLGVMRMNRDVVKIYHLDGDAMPGRGYTSPFVDLSRVEVRGGEVIHNFGRFTKNVFNAETFFPLIRVPFGPIRVWVPRRPELVVQGKYGDLVLTHALPPGWDHLLGRSTGHVQERVPLSAIEHALAHSYGISLVRRTQ